eukprot:TRINITY_DN17542_c0_g3_i1.p1 TRINITY_DN17542_c0_g3~~TRINITY_DN17542_c0_g3_i1.p1  ORF type:complete len:174 (+),score=29.60 TRINITY_DN17542_c0_g3_i1:123-644(+)
MECAAFPTMACRSCNGTSTDGAIIQCKMCGCNMHVNCCSEVGYFGFICDVCSTKKAETFDPFWSITPAENSSNSTTTNNNNNNNNNKNNNNNDQLMRTDTANTSSSTESTEVSAYLPDTIIEAYLHRKWKPVKVVSCNPTSVVVSWHNGQKTCRATCKLEKTRIPSTSGARRY